MSSYGNHCHTTEREVIANYLVTAANNLDDVTFEKVMDGITTLADMKAVAALAIEDLAGKLVEYVYGWPTRCPGIDDPRCKGWCTVDSRIGEIKDPDCFRDA